jgi:DNA-binding HxlR family transcriptional regulator
MCALLSERYGDKLRGLLSCYDRIVIHGTLPTVGNARGMTLYLSARHIRIFDYPRFAEPFRDELRVTAERLATENGLKIEFVRDHELRKDELIRELIKTRGDKPGLVAILSAMERCATYKPWYDKKTGETYLKPDEGRCLHYYFYFIDEELGLCYVRVPTWCPFRLQVYFNGHNWLAAQLRQRGIGFTMIDNAFVEIEDWNKAQKIADGLGVKKIHKLLDRFARRYCPVIRRLALSYHWSIMQAEFATDIVFRRQGDLGDVYDTLIRTAIHAVKADNVTTFLGRKLHGNFKDELGNDFHTRIEGTRIKHHMGPVSIKMYDKFGLILRIETTTNDVSFFKHYREVEQRDGTRVMKWAPMKKGIYSLAHLRLSMGAANRRYLEFISALDDSSAGIRHLHKISKTVAENERSYRGFNFFDDDDQSLFEILTRGEFNISGMRNADLRRFLPGKTTPHISRTLKRLRVHGLLKRAGSTYKYYLTRLGRVVLLAGLKLKEFLLTPQLAQHQTSSQSAHLALTAGAEA